MEWRELAINALTDRGRSPRSPLAKNPLPWVERTALWPSPSLMRPPVGEDRAEWRDPRVGWSLLLPYDAKLTPAQLAEPYGEPEPLRVLWKHRGCPPIYRYQSEQGGDWYFYRCSRENPRCQPLP